MSKAPRLDILLGAVAALQADTRLAALDVNCVVLSNKIEDIADVEKTAGEYPAVMCALVGGKGDPRDTKSNAASSHELLVFVACEDMSEATAAQQQALGICDIVEDIITGNDLDLYIDPFGYVDYDVILLDERYAIYVMSFITETV